VTVVDVRPGFVDTPMTQKNSFKMPFIMDVDDAARAALKGIDRGDAIVAFPWQIATTMSALETMPDAAWRAVAKRVKF
jgi:short-subunit dehydrogenase